MPLNPIKPPFSYGLTNILQIGDSPKLNPHDFVQGMSLSWSMLAAAARSVWRSCRIESDDGNRMMVGTAICGSFANCCFLVEKDRFII